MRCVARAVLCGSLFAFVAVPRFVNAQAALTAEFRPLLIARYTAMVRGDTAALSAQLADDLVWVIGVNGAEMTKSQLLSAAAKLQAPAPRFEVDSVRAIRFGNVAVVEYRRTDHWKMGAGELVPSWRALDVFVRRGGQWHLERHTEVWLVSPVAAAMTLDSAALNVFVGRYQIVLGYIDDVHWENKQLVATASGQTVGAHLVPVSNDAFSPNGVGALIVFERDATGRVLGYVQGYPDGRVVRAARLP